jgi:hypothetical protein
MLSYGANVINWDEILSSRMKCYHVELMFFFFFCGLECVGHSFAYVAHL